MTVHTQKHSWIGTGRSIRIAVWVAFGLTLHLAEGALIPRALPFRLGLANLAALLALRIEGLRTALQVSIWRTVLGSMLYGTFLQMNFAMSLSGAVLGTLMMGVAAHLCGRFFSEIGISLAGAAGSVAGQLGLSVIILGSEMVLLLPAFLILGMVGGLVNGLIACFVLDGRRE